jgi:hypothetical protein
MAVSKTHSSKSPSQRPEDFYKLKQAGGAYGKPETVPEKLPSGPLVEPVMGRAALYNQSKNK